MFKNRFGFTLIELLVAISFVCIFILIVLGVVALITKSMRVSDFPPQHLQHNIKSDDVVFTSSQLSAMPDTVQSQSTSERAMNWQNEELRAIRLELRELKELVATLLEEKENK